MYSTRVLVLLALLVGFAHCFSWDIVVWSGDKQLEFYYNGTLTHTEKTPFVTRVTSVTYDPVHYRVLFADDNYPNNISIYSFDLSTRKIQSLFTKDSEEYYVQVVFDPVTQLLIWKETNHIYTFPINSLSSNKAVVGNLLATLDPYHNCRDLALDSCGGYIYWITDYEIERARLDGSEREVIVNSEVDYRTSLAIDQQTQRIYWIDIIQLNNDYQMSIESSNFNGTKKTTLYNTNKGRFFSSLAISKDFIYWQNYALGGTWQLPKNSSEHVARNLFPTTRLSHWAVQILAVRYTIQEQTQGIQSCEALRGLMPNDSKPEPTFSICQNYCLEGDCSINAEGQPTCRCKTGYSGKRCEVNTCQSYCLNGGICSVNEQDQPACRCSKDYDGSRCEFPAYVIKYVQAVSMFRDVLSGDAPPVTLSTAEQSTCASTVF